MNENVECPDGCECAWVDDSFDHEFGTEICGHWECKVCNHACDGPYSFDDDEYDDDWE